jgi:hypothetical protein
VRFLVARAVGHVGPEVSARDIVQGGENCYCLNFPRLENKVRPGSGVANKQKYKGKKQAFRRL